MRYTNLRVTYYYYGTR